MSKTIEIPDIAMWEETDSELAKYNIQSLSTLVKNQEEQLKANDLMINELINRINKATKEIKELYEIAKEQDSDNVNLIDRLELILNIVRG